VWIGFFSGSGFSVGDGLQRIFRQALSTNEFVLDRYHRNDRHDWNHRHYRNNRYHGNDRYDWNHRHHGNNRNYRNDWHHGDNWYDRHDWNYDWHDGNGQPDHAIVPV